jgi:hypothetical protein
MKNILLISFILLGIYSHGQKGQTQIADPDTYLSELKSELQVEWPKNRTINVVFHGHSVPAGFFKTPVVNTLSAYPNLFLSELKSIYPYAVVNVIVIRPTDVLLTEAIAF